MFIELHLKAIITVHGFDADNRELREEASFTHPVRKIVPASRIQSIGERFVLVEARMGRQAYWEYVEDYDTLKARLETAGLLAS